MAVGWQDLGRWLLNWFGLDQEAEAAEEFAAIGPTIIADRTQRVCVVDQTLRVQIVDQGERTVILQQ